MWLSQVRVAGRASTLSSGAHWRDLQWGTLARWRAGLRGALMRLAQWGCSRAEAEKSAVDQGHTAESVHALPPAPAAAAAVAPPALPANVAVSSIPVPLALASPPSLPLPHGVLVSGASALAALQTLVTPPPVQAAVGGPAQGKAVGAGPESAHLVAPAAAPVQPVAQRHTESQSHGAAGGNAVVQGSAGGQEPAGQELMTLQQRQEEAGEQQQRQQQGPEAEHAHSQRCDLGLPPTSPLGCGAVRWAAGLGAGAFSSGARWRI
ncbi:unnamed protein product [Closterium sp. NIES-53]